MSRLARLEAEEDILLKRYQDLAAAVDQGRAPGSALADVSRALEQASTARAGEQDRLRNAGTHPDQIAARDAQQRIASTRAELDRAYTQDANDAAASRYREAVAHAAAIAGWDTAVGWVATAGQDRPDEGRAR